ncbi:DMT family transporter [Saccharicrinis aurantiacus]|uniref:DMT family transporter n=1 Tax=Saccharicrinis aurantiacus TaxID=1849719 RepID=UPI0024939D1B|nr:DMT family transporter [Saccharicrinis aurantiacus]
MINNLIGESAALATAVCWTITAIAFELAGKKVGSLPVNLIRLVIAFFIIGIFSYFRKGMFVATDASNELWLWLSISGIIGFVIGDLLLFQAFVVIGARLSMLIMALSPPMSALLGYFILNENLSFVNMLGMAVTIAGIAIVVLNKETKSDQVEVSYPIKGILLAIGGAFGQALGLVLSKYGMKDYDPFLSTQIRIIAAIVGFAVLFSVLGIWPKVFSALRNKPAMLSISIGSVFGPFLGVSLSLLAIQYTTTGIAATIMSIVPILIIVPSIVIFKEKVKAKEIIGAVIAVCGVILFFAF